MTTPDSPAIPTLERIREHLNFDDPTYTADDGKLLEALAAAVELVSTDPGLPLIPAAFADGQDHPALRWALLELVRDMWTGSFSGANGLPLGIDVAEETELRDVVTLGRSAIPPYVRGLLAPFAGGGSTHTPRGAFPPPQPYPCSW